MALVYGWNYSSNEQVPLACNASGELVVAGSSGSGTKATAATRSSVNAVATNTQLVAANSARLGVGIFNDADVDLYLAFGSSAATTSNFTIKMAAGGFYEVPDVWAGLEIRGVWAASPTGAARITEVA